MPYEVSAFAFTLPRGARAARVRISGVFAGHAEALRWLDERARESGAK